MARKFLVLVVLALALVADRYAPRAEDSSAATTITFDDSALGRPPTGFTVGITGGGQPPSWVVEDDRTAPSGARVLVQKSADATRSRFPLCVYDAITTVDGTFSVKFKPISGVVDQAGGLVWRYVDHDNYYLVRANALEGNVVLYKVEKGKRSDLKPVNGGFMSYGKKATVERGRWQTLSVRVRGSRFSVSLNGEHLFDVDDATFREPGKVGVWTKADSVAAFDDLTIDARTGVPGA